VLAGVWVEVVALVAALAIAVVTTPAGVSGAVLLLPFQVSVLGTPSPSVTPTNLLYNVVARPGAIWRYWRQGQTGGRLTWLLLSGWLRAPVLHCRDVGSELLVKLALLDRAGADPCELLRHQRAEFGPLAAALAEQVSATTGIEHTLALWRHEAMSATMQFLDDCTRVQPP
jgi:hypothetical protein